MKIGVMSDLHLEFGTQAPLVPNVDVLLLAGDITTTRFLKSDTQTGRNWLDFMKSAAERTNGRVFCVMGNHEHYQGDFAGSAKLIKAALPQGCRLLDNEYVELGEWLLFGGTMWTKMGADENEDRYIARSMNDFQIVQNSLDEPDPTRLYTRFTPAWARKDHNAYMRALKTMLKDHPDRRVIVMSHHAPHEMGVHSHYRMMTGGGGAILNKAYFQNLDRFIKANPVIKHWIHGHTHLKSTYSVGQCIVHSNSRGYFREASWDDFDPQYRFEVP